MIFYFRQTAGKYYFRKIQEELGADGQTFEESVTKVKEFYREVKDYFSSADLAALLPLDLSTRIYNAKASQTSRSSALDKRRRIDDNWAFRLAVDHEHLAALIASASSEGIVLLPAIDEASSSCSGLPDFRSPYVAIRECNPVYLFDNDKLWNWYQRIFTYTAPKRRPGQVARFDEKEAALRKLIPFLKVIFPKIWKRISLGKLPDLKMSTYWSQFLPLYKKENASRGVFDIEIPVPSRYESLREIFSLFDPEEFQKLIESLKMELMEQYERLERFINEPIWTERIISETSLFPAHTSKSCPHLNAQCLRIFTLGKYDIGSAVIVGDHHFITFDNHAYDFAGECSYLLARDFEENTFTVSIDYERSSRGDVERRSIVFEYMKNKVEVLSDGKVLINGRQYALPWQTVADLLDTAELTVTRPTQNSVLVTTADHIRLICCFNSNFCTLILPGRFHGRSAGLFGINDFEPSNDLSSPDGRKASHLTDFASQWSTNQRCSSAMNVAPQPATTTPKELTNKCSNFFEDRWSSLRPCFAIVDPAPYLKTCLSSGRHRAASTSTDNFNVTVCNVAAVYVAMCKIRGLNIPLPDMCVKCVVPNHPALKAEESLKFDQHSNVIDVVFAVEERSCMSDVPAELDRIAQTLESQVARRGYDIRYVVVGFNGKEVHHAFHMNSDDGQMRAPYSTFRESLLNNLHFHEADPDKEGEQAQIDPLTILDTIPHVCPFRLRSTKFVVLSACTACTGDEVSTAAVKDAYLKAGITPFLLTPNFKQPSKTHHDIVTGMEAGLLYTARGRRPLKENDVASVPGLCPQLFMELNGTVMTSDLQVSS
ncbi:unnamed protein product [Soboliphyme baturini]|uniref:VWFD domain-containing protein n=1 Tax=Soboliphyme baturini TaxID=241478 RepID=A0A183IVR3_9BILA|nr:unnamed protein product [Soboliphyme baturini]